MIIKDHLLESEFVKLKSTPNKGGEFIPKYLVFHFTAGRSCESSVDWLCNPKAKASAHLVVGRDGNIVQLAPFNEITWHAGKSSWHGLIGMNHYSIGIELDNAGKLTKIGSKYKTWFQSEILENNVIQAKHKNETDIGYWHDYTDIQIERAQLLASLLVDHYKLKGVLGHEDIAPGRKNDPGPAFPFEQISAYAFGRMDDEDEVYTVNIDGLNIRKGPGIEFDTVAKPLLAKTEIFVIETHGHWSRVNVRNSNDTEGWVNNKFITSVS